MHEPLHGGRQHTQVRRVYEGERAAAEAVKRIQLTIGAAPAYVPALPLSRPSASAKPSTVGRPCIATASRWCDRSLKVAAAGVFFGIHL